TNYKIKSYPTTYFDGGFKLNVGAGSTSAAKTAYSTSLTACENRVVNDVDIKVEAKWLGNASMEICVNVQNNTPGDYDAIVRCYVTEIESSMGWLDTFGNPYTFAFLDYAVYTLETIASNDSWGICTIWDGNPLGYGGIQRDNIMIIATVSEKDAHTGYSDPPSGNPFVAYYLDDATATVPQTLLVDSDTLPASGGIINYSVSAGVENANRNYYLLGSVTGTEPGLPLPGGMVTLPLVWDPLTDLMLNLANSPALPNWRGVLDASGQAIPGPQLNTWGPVPPTAVGTTIYAAYLLYYIPSYYPYDFVSNPVSFEIVP
ncbi:MAG: hypothetical protein SWE60_25155, partial [Thermodesulfobacteriota bacterium]|nr:hypothetical protein [Thermodesulfobacteriota bacterium]